MLVRLSPEQIVKNWEKFRPLFIANMIPKVSITPEVVFSILQKMLTEHIQLWAGVEEGNGLIEERVFGFVATTIDIDAMTQQRNLLIYSLFAIKEIPISAWEPGLRILEEFKNKNNCAKLIAYTEIPEVVTLAKRLGFKTMSFLLKE